MTESLHVKHCQPLPEGSPALSGEQIQTLLAQVSGWQVSDDNQSINRVFEFDNFYQTMGFANAVAWIANREDHHPDLQLSYKRCEVKFTTHSVGGLSENDFICAAKIDAIAF